MNIFDAVIQFLNLEDPVFNGWWNYEVDYGAEEEEVVVHLFKTTEPPHSTVFH
tara:strand:+ start:253 stop:411 length:159 start_codon:yes stop_codon:yes gene_type:complete